MKLAVTPSVKNTDHIAYNEDYFERGPVLGISGYMNYSWMPELTMRMAHKFILAFPIAPHETVLDFGCAKGYLVKALRLLDVEAFGVDVSEYALSHADVEVRDFCAHVTGCDDLTLFQRDYDWLIAKDVMEHLSEVELSLLLRAAVPRVKKIFAAVPLASDDECGKYIIPEYDRDVTHITAKSFGWWQRLFSEHEWTIERASHQFDGCKENWTSRWDEGNAFFIASSPGTR